ncbi:FtsX-like permease family protein [Streptomyces sp. NBC_01716]|uniref:FtsX-like permease family protein n=1 Tax=Streptomyces sp. NBC_01716 TaxID=2975917 RepID=UPI002E377101|nr:FtsX-like permease family protein [Streptomyces sp. NBC_01716]
MFTLAMRSIVQRPGRLIATLLSAFLGSVIIMSFNSMHDTAGGANIDDRSSETLTTAATVVGGYGTLLVFFAIASTLTVNVRQRGEEIALLRRTGATPAQIKRMIVVESAVVAVVSMLLAILPARIGGEQLLNVFKDTDQVAGSVDFVFGPIALTAGVSVGLIAAIGASFLAVRRATKAAAGGAEPGGRGRNIAGFAALALGIGSVGSTFAFDKTDDALMAAPAYGAILISVGFAVFSPVLLKFLLGKLARPITLLTGASGYLTVHNMRRRAAQLSGVLMPLILFIGMATATLYMQAVQNDELDTSGITRSVDDKSLETLNFVVVGIIVVFACIMLINTLYAATTYRTREFGQQRLAGATPSQVLRMVAIESLVLTVTGAFFGTLAAAAGAVPFSVVRVDAVLPGQGPGIWLAIVGIGAAATVVTSVGTAYHALRTPAVEAVSLAA